MNGRGPVASSFVDVDAGDTSELVAMMDDTDRWEAVRSARSWVLDRAGAAGGFALDVGCGPGTFSQLARARRWSTVDLDRSDAMVGVARSRSGGAPGVIADVARLPFPDGAFDLVHCERVLQWADDPSGALAELWRVTASGGVLAVTDTDWGSLVVDDPGSDALPAAALGWVTHPELARSIPRRLAELGAAEVRARADAIALTVWDPDDPSQHDGPPGLPLGSIATGASGAARTEADAAVGRVAAAARHGDFFAALTIVTTVARR